MKKNIYKFTRRKNRVNSQELFKRTKNLCKNIKQFFTRKISYQAKCELFSFPILLFFRFVFGGVEIINLLLLLLSKGIHLHNFHLLKRLIIMRTLIVIPQKP